MEFVSTNQFNLKHMRWHKRILRAGRQEPQISVLLPLLLGLTLDQQRLCPCAYSTWQGISLVWILPLDREAFKACVLPASDCPPAFPAQVATNEDSRCRGAMQTPSLSSVSFAFSPLCPSLLVRLLVQLRRGCVAWIRVGFGRESQCLSLPLHPSPCSDSDQPHNQGSD